MSLDLPAFVWKQLVAQPVDCDDVRDVKPATLFDELDTIAHKCTDDVEGRATFEDRFQSDKRELCWVAYLADNSTVELVDGGRTRPVGFEERLVYRRAAMHHYLREGCVFKLATASRLRVR